MLNVLWLSMKSASLQEFWMPSYSTRLETRSKEFTACARVRLYEKPCS